MEHLSSLNEAQKLAARTTDGPVLVLAGAGAGKTTTIAHRIVHLVKEGVPTNQILAITFTNKAAREMRERILALLVHYHIRYTHPPTISTFHAFSAILLREFARDAGLSKHFVIYDRSDSLRTIRRALRALGEDDKRTEPRTILGTISRAKGDAKTLADFMEQTGSSWYHDLVARVWERYDAELRKEGAVDFDDLLLLTYTLLAHNDTVRSTLSKRYRYLHVDEYQDTNHVQYELARLLSEAHRNIFCVGDLDQNVYSWRGSTVENILEFEHTYPEATILKLEENYRSSATIVEVSNEIIKKNRRRREKTLFTSNPQGELLSLIVGYDERDEAQKVAGTIRERIEADVSPKEIAVLYRANFQSRALEEAMLEAGIPYRVLGTRFFDRAEVKDTLAYLRAALNPDGQEDVRRIINTPLRGIGKITVDRLFRDGREALTGAARMKVDAFFALLADLGTHASKHKVSETLAYILDRSGIAASLAHKSEDDTERLENTKELVSLAASRYDALGDDAALRLLEDAALATDQDELDSRRTNEHAVTLMTIHAAKGLEFREVFITGLEDGLFPHERTDVSADDEEERRLFYVALTRAKRKVYLSYALVRTVFGATTPRAPSEFIEDIGPEFLEQGAATGSPTKVVYLD